ncbi:hypothetical protein P692DRAFT_20772753 [Suillus brevipes Sb2]|nr:hypothetical protein P692DRAFT_20772753 [Suillus brevipes Sb2]
MISKFTQTQIFQYYLRCVMLCKFVANVHLALHLLPTYFMYYTWTLLASTLQFNSTQHSAYGVGLPVK